MPKNVIPVPAYAGINFSGLPARQGINKKSSPYQGLASRRSRGEAGRGMSGLSGQASLEMTVSLICVFILMFGALNVFLWVNKQMVQRQEYYEHAPGDADKDGIKYGGKYDYGRVAAGDFSGDVPIVNETKFYRKLDIFGTQQ